MSPSEKLTVFVAKGLGSGYVPKGPGTVGSVVGLGWFALLLFLSPDPLIYSLATAGSILISVWCCGSAERILKLKDPGSIVLDEIIALPICFLPLILHHHETAGSMPTVSDIFIGQWMVVLAVFAGFRFFDILKPWPINRIQDLPGGWGVTADDVLAGVYVAAILWLAGF